MRTANQFCSRDGPCNIIGEGDCLMQPMPGERGTHVTYGCLAEIEAP